MRATLARNGLIFSRTPYSAQRLYSEWNKNSEKKWVLDFIITLMVAGDSEL